MSNHYPVVLHVDREQAEGWTDVDVIEHWRHLFAGHPLTHRLLAGDTLLKVEHNLVAERVKNALLQ